MGQSFRYRKQSLSESQSRMLIQECEHFLTGTYAFELLSHGLPVPEWAWLNVLVHAPVEVLVAQAARSHRKRLRLGVTAQWRETVAILADELMTAASHAGCDVEELQRSILLALELERAWPAVGSSLTDPHRLAQEVRQALRGFQDMSPPGEPLF
jgi:urease gamma subunit